MLLSQGRQAAQGGDRRVALASVKVPGALFVTVVPVEVVVAGGAEQGARRGQVARQNAPTVGVGGVLPESH